VLLGGGPGQARLFGEAPHGIVVQFVHALVRLQYRSADGRLADSEPLGYLVLGQLFNVIQVDYLPAFAVHLVAQVKDFFRKGAALSDTKGAARRSAQGSAEGGQGAAYSPAGFASGTALAGFVCPCHSISFRLSRTGRLLQVAGGGVRASVVVSRDDFLFMEANCFADALQEVFVPTPEATSRAVHQEIPLVNLHVKRMTTTAIGPR